MKRNAWSCLAALVLAAWAAGTTATAVAQETGPTAGITETQQPNPQAGRPPTDPAPGPVTAPGKAGAAKRETYPFRGVVASVDATARTVTLEGKGSRRVIAILPDTRLIRAGNPATLEDVKAGEKVGGTLKKSGEGREVALLFRVGDKPEESSATGKKRAKASPEASGPSEL